MKFPDKGTLLDTIKGGISTLALFLAYVSLPLVGMLPGLFTPLPGMYYTLKSGKGVGVAVVLITTAVLAIIADSSALFLYLVQGGLISLALPHFLARGYGAARTISFSVAVSLACILLFAAAVWLVQGVNLHGEILKGINYSISQTSSLYEKSGLTGEDLLSLQQGMKQAGALIARVYPALVLVSLGAIAGLNLLALARLAARSNRPLPIGDFRKFRNPDQLIWVVIFAGFALLLKSADVSTAALNVLIVTLTLYSLQGLAIIAHSFERFAVPRFVRVIFYVLLALQPYLTVAVAALGIFDLWGNFRTPRQQKNL
jgi:uncharacterized protein YybS (DUF2232 family)